MTNTSSTSTSTSTSTATSTPAAVTGPATLDRADPRYGLAAAVAAAARAIESATAAGSDLLGRPTPCSEFTVEDLIEHMIFIARRVAKIGNGGHFADTPAHRVGSDWTAAFACEAETIHAAWADPSKLASLHEVPWGRAPGAALMLAYTAEFTTHAWDLSRAVGADMEIDDAVLVDAAEAVRFIPADGRDDPAIPFGPVVEAPTDGSNLERIVTWVGRSLDWAPPAG